MPRTTTKPQIEAGEAGQTAALSPVSGTSAGVKPAAKAFFLKTFGCQMNVYDSERMTEALARDGYYETKVIEDADLVILNTCHIREKAAEKVYSDLGRIRAVKSAREADGKEMLITVAGCVAQAEGQEIVRRQPAVDLVVGPQSYHRLGTLLQQARADGRAVVETEFAENAKFKALPEARRLSGPSAFLTVQEGCDKFCTFCVVPYTRGEEFSRPGMEVLSEARRLVEAGAREIMLLGQNVNAYHGVGADGGDISLAALIRELAKIDGLDRLRYTTSHPRDMRDDLIEAHADVDALMPYLHLPVQAGSDRILAAMNRRHTAEEYLRAIERVRTARPDIAISGDFIVGFPGETEADFEATMALVREVRYAQAFSFKYSPRAGTPAAGHDGQVPEEVKSERLQRLQALLEEQQVAFNAACVGRELPVLFERQGRGEGVLVGRTPYLQLIHVEDAGGLSGEIGTAKVTGFRQMSLTGRLVPVTGAA